MLCVSVCVSMCVRVCLCVSVCVYVCVSVYVRACLPARVTDLELPEDWRDGGVVCERREDLELQQLAWQGVIAPLCKWSLKVGGGEGERWSMRGFDVNGRWRCGDALIIIIISIISIIINSRQRML